MVPVGQWILVSTVIVTLIFLYSQAVIAEQNVFMGVSGKVCPGDNLSFECTLHGGTGTVWQGSVFDHCADMGTSNEITLLHDDLKFTQAERTCNNVIVVQGIQAENGSFTSQLSINVTFDMIGKTIECNPSDSNKRVGTPYVINFSIAVCYPGPDRVHISAVDTGLKQISFSWNPVGSDYPDISYKILASNCGSCPTTTNHTFVTCTNINIPINDSMCIFVVQTTVNENLVGGNTSHRVRIKNIIPSESQDEFHALIRNKGTFIAGIVLMVIAFLLITVFCCVFVGLKITKVRSSSRLRDVSVTISTHQDKIPENDITSCEHDDKECSELEETPLDLKSLLQKLKGRVSKQWYQFGLLLGIPMDVLEGFNLYSEEDCLVEVLDHWLKHHPGKPTWHQITDAQRKIETFNDCQNSADKKAAAGAIYAEVPQPKPPRRSSSVTARKSDTAATNKNNSAHEYDYID